MNTTLTELDGLLREIKVEYPADDLLLAIKKEIIHIAKTVKIDGFRPGKVPIGFIKKKYGHSIKTDIAQKKINEILPNIFAQEKLTPATTPNLIKLDINDDKALKFTIQFEVFPTISLKPIQNLEFEQLVCQISDKDVTQTLEDLRKQKAEYQPVTGASKEGDKVNIDFKGSIGSEVFQGGEATGFELILGDKKMITGFEEGIIGKKVNDSFILELVFPKDYQAKNLAGKQVSFDIHINQILSATLPKLDDALAKQYQEESLDALKEITKKQMGSELEKRLSSNNKELAFSALLAANPIEIPVSSIKEEADKLLADIKQKMGEQANNQALSSVSFEEEAKRRLQLGLLFSQLTKDAEITVNDEDIKQKIEQIATEYNQSKETVVQWYYEDTSRLANIESGLLEERTLNHLVQHAKINTTHKNFKELVDNT